MVLPAGSSSKPLFACIFSIAFAALQWTGCGLSEPDAPPRPTIEASQGTHLGVVHITVLNADNAENVVIERREKFAGGWAEIQWSPDTFLDDIPCSDPGSCGDAVYQYRARCHTNETGYGDWSDVAEGWYHLPEFTVRNLRLKKKGDSDRLSFDLASRKQPTPKNDKSVAAVVTVNGRDDKALLEGCFREGWMVSADVHSPGTNFTDAKLIITIEFYLGRYTSSTTEEVDLFASIDSVYNLSLSGTAAVAIPEAGPGLALSWPTRENAEYRVLRSSPPSLEYSAVSDWIPDATFIDSLVDGTAQYTYRIEVRDVETDTYRGAYEPIAVSPSQLFVPDTITVLVTDSCTGLAIPSAKIAYKGHSYTCSEQGVFTTVQEYTNHESVSIKIYPDGFKPKDVAVNLPARAADTTIARAVPKAGCKIDTGVTRIAAIRVLDSCSLTPLSGVSVNDLRTSQAAFTDTDGLACFEHQNAVTGDTVEFSFSLTDYIDKSTFFAITEQDTSYATILMAPATPCSTSTSARATISTLVYDSCSTKPIENAVVTIDGIGGSFATDTAGVGSSEVIVSGDSSLVTISVSAEGFQPFTKTIIVKPNEISATHCPLTPLEGCEVDTIAEVSLSHTSDLDLELMLIIDTVGYSYTVGDRMGDLALMPYAAKTGMGENHIVVSRLLPNASYRIIVEDYFNTSGTTFPQTDAAIAYIDADGNETVVRCSESSGAGSYWHVGTINPTTGGLTVHNTLSDQRE